MKTPTDIERYQDYYQEPQFWDKLKSVARKAGVKLVYVALVLYYTLQSPALSAKEKGLILGALGYFILPVDLIPDFLPGVGLTDDLAALVIVFTKLAANITPEIKAQAKKKVTAWFGDGRPDSAFDPRIDEQ